MATLRDALSEALGKSEEGTLETPVETPVETTAATEPVHEETASEREERMRDERGRFAPKQEASEPATEPPQSKKPPTSWKKDYWGHWEKIGANPELAPLQNYIEQREADYAKGVSTYKAQWDQAAPIVEAIQPFMPELQQYGIQPQQWISNLGNAHRTLAMGSPEQKLQMFAKLATDYGVPLQALTGQPVDPQFGHVTQTVSALQNQVQNLLNAQKQSQEQELSNHIAEFQKGAPHFEAVKQTMAGLLQSGVANDLKTAYDKAIRLHDDIWQQHQAEQLRAEAAERQRKVAEKKAAAVSPRSTSPTGSMSAGNTKKSLRDQLSEAAEGLEAGRF